MADINYTPAFSTQPDFTGRIIQGTKIIDVPTILNTMIADDRQYFIDNFTSNFNSLSTAVKNYFDDLISQNNADLKADILSQVLVLNPDATYDITVTSAGHALEADNASTLENKNLADIYDHVATNLIPPSTVANALLLNGETRDDILADVPDILVNNAKNSNLLEGKSVNDIKVDIKAEIISESTVDASTLEGQTLSDIVNAIRSNVESSSGGWTAARAATFGGETPSEWEAKISGGTVAVAQDADKLNGKTLSEINSMWDADILTATDNYLTQYDEDITQKIKTTLVDNAVDSQNFDGDDRTTWLTTIKTSLVDNAVDTQKFDGDDRATWITTINNLIESNNNLMATIESKVTSQWKAYDALNADHALTADVLDAAYRADIITDAAAYVGTLSPYINAFRLDGNSVQDIIDQVSVSASADIIARGANFIHHPYSSIGDDLLQLDEAAVFISQKIFGVIGIRLSDIITSSYSNNGVPGASHKFSFDLDAFADWDKVDITYNSNGLPQTKKYYYLYDREVNFSHGANLISDYYGYQVSTGTITSVEYYGDLTVRLTGTAAANATVNITFRDGSTDSVVADADGNWQVISANPQERYPEIGTYPENLQSLLLITADYQYNTDNILTNIQYKDFNDVLIFERNFDRTWETLPFKTEVLLDVKVPGSGSSTNFSKIHTEFEERHSDIIKKVTTVEFISTSSTAFELLQPDTSFTPNINLGVIRDVSVPASPSAGDTANITYTIYNLSGVDLTDISINESNTGYTVSGSIASLPTTTQTDSSSITGTFTLTASEISAGGLPDSNITISVTDANGDTFDIKPSEYKPGNSEYNLKITTSWYSQTNSTTKISTVTH